MLISNTDLQDIKILLKALALDTVLYGSDNRAVRAPENRMCYRKILKVKWIDKIRNKEVLESLREKPSLWGSIAKRRDRLVGDI